MKKTSYKQREHALKEWISEAEILGMQRSIIQKTKKDFEQADKMIRRWENELLEILSIRKFAA
jgi:hypothetical protein